MSDHHPPPREHWSPEAEQSVLGALLLDSEALAKLDDLLVGDFFDGRHRIIFGAIKDMAAKRLPIDVVTVFEWLRDRQQGDYCGGLQHLNALHQCVPGAANIARHAAIVKDKATRRAIINAADQAREIASVPGDTAELLDRIATLFVGLRRAGGGHRPAQRLGEVLAARSAHWDALADGSESPGIPLGIESIDEALGGGAKPGLLITIGARPSVGKTSLAQQIAQHVAGQGFPVLMVSQEMSAELLADRAAANLGRVNLGRIATGRFEGDDWARLVEAVEAAASLPLYVDDRPARSLLDIRARAREVRQECGGLALIVVDYLQLCASAAGATAAQHRHHQIEAISRGMKQLARELETTVLMVSQLKRADQCEPELDDLKESGAIEEDADVVILLHPWGADGTVLAKLPKNRQGRRGRLALHFDGALQRWSISSANVSRVAEKERG